MCAEHLRNLLCRLKNKLEENPDREGRNSILKELEEQKRKALRANERELAHEIQDVIDEYDQDYGHRAYGPRATSAVFCSAREEFNTAKEAYIWLIKRFFARLRERTPNIDDPAQIARGRREIRVRASLKELLDSLFEGTTLNEELRRVYFSKDLRSMFNGAPHLADNPANYYFLEQDGLYINLNLSNRQKREILERFAGCIELHQDQWAFEPESE